MKKSFWLTQAMWVSLLFLSGCDSLDFVFGDGIIDSVTRYVPDSFECSMTGFEEFEDVVEKNIEEEDQWFGSDTEAENDHFGEIYIYLQKFNNTVRSKCNMHYPGLFNYCMRFDEEYKQNSVYEYEDNSGRFRDFLVFVTTGPVEAFGIYSARNEGYVKGTNEFVGNTYDNVLKDNRDGSDEHDTYPGTNSDFRRRLDCFQDAIGEGGTPGDYNTRTWYAEGANQNYYSYDGQRWNQ